MAALLEERDALPPLHPRVCFVYFGSNATVP
jgi:hypothetical protein